MKNYTWLLYSTNLINSFPVTSLMAEILLLLLLCSYFDCLTTVSCCSKYIYQSHGHRHLQFVWRFHQRKDRTAHTITRNLLCPCQINSGPWTEVVNKNYTKLGCTNVTDSLVCRASDSFIRGCSNASTSLFYSVDKAKYSSVCGRVLGLGNGKAFL